MKRTLGMWLMTGLLAVTLTGSLWADSRTNVIWARTTAEEIVLDGQLNEASWANAETRSFSYGDANKLLPGSGYRLEAGAEPTDPMSAEVKFLVKDNKLYMAVTVQDSSVGGGLFNRFDGFLMNLRDHSGTGRPAGNFEYFYGWVAEGWADTTLDEEGAEPGFFGWAATDRNVWDGKTVVHGLSNNDATLDEDYTTELMFDLTVRGYDVTDADGDIVEFNISIYDADWQWPEVAEKFSGNRTWWAGPWGNGSAYDVIRIYAQPSVTTASGTTPEIGPEMVIPNGAAYAEPVIDGQLDEAVWGKIDGFDIRFGDDALRASYPAIGPYRSGQWQPAINGITATVVDPGDATIKAFFKDHYLYLAVDAQDQAVWGINNPDMWDGIRFVINDHEATDEFEHVQLRRNLTAVIDTLGNLMMAGDLTALADTGAADVAMSLKGTSTVNDYNDVDEGYQIEMKIDLTYLGYPADLGDKVLFFSATLFDGEKFANSADDYGTRTWFFREDTWPAAPAWAYMDANTFVSVDDNASALPTSFELLGNYPNPFNPTTQIRFALPMKGEVMMVVFNTLGQELMTMPLGQYEAGIHSARFDATRLSSGLYFYRLSYEGQGMKKVIGTGKMAFIK